jgi:hypothetical protein
MCIPVWKRSLKDRTLMAVANLALCIGLVLPYVVHPAGQRSADWLDGIRGLLIGMSIGMNLLIIRLGKRCAPTVAHE